MDPKDDVEKVVEAFKAEGCTPEEAEAAKERLRDFLTEQLNSPEAVEGRRRNAEKVAADEARLKA